MILGIDASNLRVGGGLTHLIEILGAANPPEFGFRRVIVWGNKRSLDNIEDRPWLQKTSDPWLERSLLWRVLWQIHKLPKSIDFFGCDLIFVPGGSYFAKFRPSAVISQNLLPFEWRELWRFRISVMTLKLLLLRIVQTLTFRRAEGLIFLSNYAAHTVQQVVGSTTASTQIIPHGISRRFLSPVREQSSISNYSPAKPFRLLYVSTVSVYKHQDKTALAVVKLREKGINITLDLVGGGYPASVKALDRIIKKANKKSHLIRYHGEVDYESLHHFYREADAFIFSSTCENLPIILLEAMASGLPIACSRSGPMPEILGDAGIYFDPGRVESIYSCLHELISDSKLRKLLAEAASKRVEAYSWDRCATQTFTFLAEIARKKNNYSESRSG